MRVPALLTLTFAAATLTGCAGSFGNTTATVAAPTTLSVKGMHGVVFGGQQPIGYASIQLYQAGTTAGYGQGSTALIAAGAYSPGGASGCVSSGPAAAQSCYTYPVTDGGGNFSINNEYHCTLGTQVYIVATGGNPTPNTPNAASSLMAGLGLCDNIGPGTNIDLNEITTVGTVWALAPFMPATGSGVSPLAIGTSTGNVAGLASAFSDIPTLVNIAGGSPMPSTPSLTLPVAEINTLSNILASCINSGGSGSTQCTMLFANTTSADGSTPTETISAALNIARNPGRNVTVLINNGAGIGAPFAPTIASANDLTLAATYTGTGISSPAGAAIDANGNIWIANAGNNSVTVLSHNLATANNYTAGTMNAPSAIAIDTGGNAWIANGGNSTLTELSSAGTNVTGSPFSGGGLSTPTSVAIDGLGNVWLSNSGNSAISEFNSSGVVQSGTTGFVVSGVSAPVAIAINTK